MEKQELRKQIRAAKRAVPFCEKLSRSATIMQQVEALPQFQQAKTVLLYWSMDDEVQTHDFVNRWGSSSASANPQARNTPTPTRLR